MFLLFLLLQLLFQKTLNIIISLVFHFINISEKNAIQFGSVNGTYFQYTKANLKVQIDYGFMIPRVLFPNVKCKLSDSSGFAMVTNFTVINETHPSFNCYFNTPVAGLKNISLWYSENSQQEFEISSNNLEVVFVGNKI
jgi:hypothetical protein